MPVMSASGLAAIDEGVAGTGSQSRAVRRRDGRDGRVLGGTAMSTRNSSNDEEADPLRSEIRQQFGGIGVRIRIAGEPPRLTIAFPPEPGTPAGAANLRPGDHILAIDDSPPRSMT